MSDESKSKLGLMVIDSDGGRKMYELKPGGFQEVDKSKILMIDRNKSRVQSFNDWARSAENAEPVKIEKARQRYELALNDKRASITYLCNEDAQADVSPQQWERLGKYLRDNATAILDGLDINFKACSHGALMCAIGLCNEMAKG